MQPKPRVAKAARYLAYIASAGLALAMAIHFFYPDSVPYISSYCATVSVDGPEGTKTAEGLFEFQEAAYPAYIRPFKRHIWQSAEAITLDLGDGRHLRSAQIGQFIYARKSAPPSLSQRLMEYNHEDKALYFQITPRFTLLESNKHPKTALITGTEALQGLLGPGFRNLRMGVGLNAGRRADWEAIVYDEPCSRQPSVRLD